MRVQISPSPAKLLIPPIRRRPTRRPAPESFGSGDEFSLDHWVDIRRAIHEDSAADSDDPDCADWT
jgi:hypothetical protein